MHGKPGHAITVPLRRSRSRHVAAAAEGPDAQSGAAGKDGQDGRFSGSGALWAFGAHGPGRASAIAVETREDARIAARNGNNILAKAGIKLEIELLEWVIAQSSAAERLVRIHANRRRNDEYYIFKILSWTC